MSRVIACNTEGSSPLPGGRVSLSRRRAEGPAPRRASSISYIGYIGYTSYTSYISYTTAS